MASNWCDTATIQWIGFIRNKYRKECMTRVEWLEFLHPNPMLQPDLLPFCHLVMHKPHDILLSSMARPPFHFPANSFYSRRLVPFFTDRRKFYFVLKVSGNAGEFSSALNVGPLSSDFDTSSCKKSDEGWVSQTHYLFAPLAWCPNCCRSTTISTL